MGIPIYILGKSGSGKSTSMRNLDPKDIMIIKVINKRLPFNESTFATWDKESKTGSKFATDDYTVIKALLTRMEEVGKKIVIIDDIQYLMANEFMRRASEVGFTKFSEIAFKMWDLLDFIQNKIDPDMRVYMMSHIDEEDGSQKIKTIGKMLDDKVCLEGLATIVLGSSKVKDDYVFETQTNGRNTLKSPIGMFEKTEPNDLNIIDNKIVTFYEIA
jgi:adenylate kinase family enzyme